MAGKEGQMKLFKTTCRDSTLAQLSPLSFLLPLSLCSGEVDRSRTTKSELTDPRLVQGGPTYEMHDDETLN